MANKVIFIFVLIVLCSLPVHAQGQPVLNMGFSGVGIGADLLKIIERNGLWRKHGLDVRVIYLSTGTLMAQTLSSGDIGISGFDTPAMLNLALAGVNLKIIAVPINRLEPFFVVRNNIRMPTDLKGKKITISRFGSTDIITRVVLRYWKLDPEKDVSFFQSGNTPTRLAALIAGHMDAALVSSTAVAKIAATGCCRVLADLSDLPLEYANYAVVASGALLKSQRDNIRRFLQALIEGIYVFKSEPDIARDVLKESSGDAEAVGPLYERLSKSFRDYPAPEVRGIQNVLDSLLTPKAKGRRADDFMDTSLMEEIRKSGFIERLYAGKG
jgi:NitT/TauT family transport system substrate-binding protein